jgi:hypothetical protein
LLTMASQNYTCAAPSAQYTPAPIGALASIYNASCVAANYPDILAMLPSIALQFPPPPSSDTRLAPANIELSGHHYFSTNTTPVFNLNASPDPARDLGVAVAHKVANSTAPANATKGVGGVGNGAVAWLYLLTTNATDGNIRAIYRLSTAGGSPPKTCDGISGVFSVQYAAAYWFYSTE